MPMSAEECRVIEVKTPPGTRNSPMHIHLEQNEWMYLLEGSFGLQCGTEKTVFADRR